MHSMLLSNLGHRVKLNQNIFGNGYLIGIVTVSIQERNENVALYKCSQFSLFSRNQCFEFQLILFH